MVKAKTTKAATTKEVVLSGSLSLKVAADIRQQLLRALDEADTVKVFLKNVEDVDLALVQILCAAHRSAVQKGKSLILQNTLPDVFIQLTKDAGLISHIGCSVEAREDCIWQGC